MATLEAEGTEITDKAEKHYRWLAELRKEGAPRRLKIEIRNDETRALDREVGIAFSPYTPNLQVRLTICTLKQMWKNKVAALIGRAAIRDAYDLDFLLRRGAGDFNSLKKDELEKILSTLDAFTARDFSSTLGALLPPEEKNRLKSGKFSLLRGAIEQGLTVEG